MLGAIVPAAAQPAPRRPAKSSSPPEPAPASDPEARARLDDQAAALAAADRKLAEQQQVIDGLSTALADARREQASLAAAQQALQGAIDAERKARLDAETAAKAAPPVPAVRATWPTLTLSGLVQIDAATRQSSEDELRQSGDLLNQDRVLLRRGRLRLSASYDKVSGLAEIDVNTVNGSQVRITTAEAAYQVAPWLTAAIGIPKIPFGFEVEQSDKERLFLERSTMVRALFPGEYDVGAKLSGRWRFLRYAIAVQNGEPAGERAFALRDPNRDKDITARAGVVAQIGRVDLAAGFSLLTGRGFHAGTPATKDVLVWKDLNEDGVVGPNEVQVIPGQAATMSSSYDRFGVGADAQLAIDLAELGKLAVYGELIVAGNLDRAMVLPDPVVLGRDLRELGFYAALVYEPAAWSALGVRYDRYDPDADAADVRLGTLIPSDASLSTLSITGALRHAHGRLILEYDHNTNHSGRTASGVPTNLGDDAVTLRAEVQL
ncbi:MAG: hypothetical protein E6J90_35830 [Deltaproteobacteria bacterium]|nr:MAG: hypothetical protein E6J91_30260 [Deltaproteobacteria bacterium]TMQ10802.1 MAG: hypothetical protein E6J90_35830 [Deltaproteobacteria bacterium]